MLSYRWHRTIALWLLGGVLVGALGAGVVLLVSRARLKHRSFDIPPNLQATAGAYRATLERVAVRGDEEGPRWLEVVARVERADGKPVAAPEALWPADEMVTVLDGADEPLSVGECRTEHSRSLDAKAYELRHSWPLSRWPEGPLRVTVRFPGEAPPDASAPLREGDVETIVQAASGSPAVLVRSVQVVDELEGAVEAGPYLVVRFADAGRIRGPGPLPTVRIAVRDADGQRMNNYREWVQEATQPNLPPDLLRAYPLKGHAGPFMLELTSDESYRRGLVEFAFEPIAIR